MGNPPAYRSHGEAPVDVFNLEPGLVCEGGHISALYPISRVRSFLHPPPPCPPTFNCVEKAEEPQQMRLREVTASSRASDSDSAWIGVWLSHYPSTVPWSASPSSLSSRFWESFTSKWSFCVKSTFLGQSQKVKKIPAYGPCLA